MATIKDVAARAGVAVSTVSKYLNGGNVRARNADAIRAAIDALDFRVNPFARNLKTQCSRSVGVLLPNITAPFYGAVLASLDRVLRANGYHGLVSFYGSNHGLERDNLQFLLNAGIDGLVYIPENISAEEFSELTESCGIPIVFADRLISGVSCDAVLVNNSDSVYRAVSHLLNNGLERIGIISGPKEVSTANERLVGYFRALSDHGIIYDDLLVASGENTFAAGYRKFSDMLDMKNPPTAVLAANYDITLGVITAAREHGIKIPEQIELFGYDCVNICRMMTPPIPVIHQPEEEIGRITGEYLIERLSGGGGSPRITRLECELII